MTKTRTYSSLMYSRNRLNLIRIPYFLLRSAYSTCGVCGCCDTLVNREGGEEGATTKEAREVYSSMATAGATANTGKEKRRTSRESGYFGFITRRERYTWGGATHSICVCSVWVPCRVKGLTHGLTSAPPPPSVWVPCEWGPPVVFLLPVASVPRLASRSC